jgi:helix-turn-helix protein
MYRTSENAKRWKERLQKIFEKGLRDAEALSRLEKEIDI